MTRNLRHHSEPWIRHLESDINLSPGFLQCYNICEIFYLIDSLSCGLQDEVNFMGYGTASGRFHGMSAQSWRRILG